MKQRKPKKKKKPTFSKKDWREIFERMSTSLMLSMVTQQLKNGFPSGTTFGGQPIETLPSNFIKPKTKTPNPGAKKLRKRLGI